MKNDTPLGVKLLIFLLALIGLGLNLWIFIDLGWIGWLDRVRRAEVADRELTPEVAELAEASRESILLVRVASCTTEDFSTGTAFLVEPGLLATCAHVVADSENCGNPIVLVDHEGTERPARLEASDRERDLALLSFEDRVLPPLVLADSSVYREVDGLVRLVTIGYPLLGAASRPDRAAVSGEGSLSSYQVDADLFVTSGLNINLGNSGGPVFLTDTWEVLAIASSQLDPDRAEGIGYSIPADAFRQFFRASRGRELGEQ